MIASRVWAAMKLPLTVLVGSIFLGTASVSAAPVEYGLFDFTDATVTPDNTDAGNKLVFTDENGSGITATVTAWADVTDAGTTSELSSAIVHQVGGTLDGSGGLGVCNSLETKCLDKDNIRSVTEAVGKDWLLVTFSENVNMLDFIVAPDTGTGNKPKSQSIDVTFFTGSLVSPAQLDGATYGDLTSVLGLAEYSVINGKSLVTQTVDINGAAGGEVWGNTLLVGGTIGGAADRIYLNGMNTVVPIPASIWLLISALGALAGQRQLVTRRQP